MRDRDKVKKKRTQIIFGLLIIFLMTFSVFGYFGDESNETVECNVHKFTQVDSNWVGYNEDVLITLMNDPRELMKNITLVGIEGFKYSSYEKAYFSVAPGLNYRPALYSYTNNLKMYIPAATNMACYNDGSGCDNLPLKDCKDATNKILIVKFMQANESKVSFDENCLIIEGEDLNIPTERFVLETVFE